MQVVMGSTNAIASVKFILRKMVPFGNDFILHRKKILFVNLYATY